MNRLILLVVASIQLLSLQMQAVAQSDSRSATLVIPCKNTESRATLKRRTSTAATSAASQVPDSEPPHTRPPQVITSLPRLPQAEFIGLDALPFSDALKSLCEDEVFSETTPFDPEKAAATLTKLLTSIGYANAQVQVFADQKNTFRFFVDQGKRFPIAQVRFQGSKSISEQQLRNASPRCAAIADDAATKNYDAHLVDYCGRLLANYVRSLGYLQGRVVPTVQLTEPGFVITYAVDEGRLYRLGKIKIEGERALTQDQIRSKLPLRVGDVASGEKIGKWLFDDLKNAYGEMGFIEYTAESVPTFKDGIVDLEVQIEEGKRFSLRSITFSGELMSNTNLQSFFLMHPGDTYNSTLFRESIARLNASGLFAPVDADGDVDFATDSEEPLLSVRINLKKRDSPH